MKDLAAAEHAKHALLALNGARTVYPKVHHGLIFSLTGEVVRHMLEVAKVVVSRPVCDVNSAVSSPTSRSVML